jgi:shikimate dehydrogenase
MKISGRTALYGVVGDPVSHSLSPLIHNFWLNAKGIDAVYVPVRLSSQNPEIELDAMSRLGFQGVNVTLPHKLIAASVAMERSEIVERIGAANTLIQRSQGGWSAHNTDVEGFVRSLMALQIDDLRGKTVVMIGAGGAARAGIVALDGMGAEISIVNRSPERAGNLLSDLDVRGRVGDLSELQAFAGQARLVINSASFGHGGAAPFDLPEGNGRLFYDMSYGAAALPALEKAHQQGWRGVDGLGMLINQAAASFRLWFDAEVDTEGAMSLCRSILQGR